MSVLYQKYRPKNFREVVNQNHIKLVLEHQLETGKAAHAYIFAGPRAVGKTTLARVFAQAVNCEQREKGKSEPCHQCPACLSIESGRNMDIIEMDAATHTGVDNVRESVIAAAKVPPVMSRNKVFIIDEVHMLSAASFNALLKTLEEPPQNIIFILCTTEIHKVPLTIISRCQRFDFRRIGVTEIAKKLKYIAGEEGIRVEDGVLATIARLSEGHMRDAESLLGQLVAVGGREISREEADLVIPRSDLSEAVELVVLASRKDAGGGIALVNRMIDEGVSLRNFLSDVLELLRKALLLKLNPALADKVSLEIGEELEARLAAANADFSESDLVNLLELMSDAQVAVKSSFLPQLPIELALVKFAGGYTKESVARPPEARPIRPPAAVQPGQAPKPAVDRTVSLAAGAPGEIRIDEVIAKWHEVLARVKTHNHSLSFVLRVCQPQGVNGNALCLAFKYKFHKDRVGDQQIKAILEKVLAEVYGKPLTIEAVIDESIETKEPAPGMAQETPLPPAPGDDKSSEVINKLLETFGGKVIN